MNAYDSIRLMVAQSKQTDSGWLIPDGETVCDFETACNLWTEIIFPPDRFDLEGY